MMSQERQNPALALLHERMTGNVLLIGLTGGIASGKSTISQYLREAGIPVIDADTIAREVVEPGHKAYEAIVERFGKSILSADKTIDRSRLGALVFEDEAARRDLEAITHPEIFREMARRIREIKDDPSGTSRLPMIVIDAALLFESGLHQSMDKNILIKIDPQLQLQRLMLRDHLSEPEARQRIDSQWSHEDKEALAPFIIDNSGSLEDTQRQVYAVLQEILLGH